jgi:hypothetical protein
MRWHLTLRLSLNMDSLIQPSLMYVPNKEKKSLTHYMIYIFMLLNVSFKKWKDSTTFVNWELLVLKLKTYCHSHVIIQSLNINCYTNIIKFFDTIITYKHPTYYIFKKQKIEKNISSASHKTKYDHIYVFDKHGSRMMYKNNATL